MWVRQILTGSDVQIVPPSDLRNGGTTISNDGEFVYYIGVNRENSFGSLFQVPILGGTPRKVMSGVRSPISFSPDGSQFTFVRENTNQEHFLMIANTDGSAERTLAVRKGNDWFATQGPAWSPDGKWIACGVGTDTGGSYMTILGYSVTDGSEKVLTGQKWHGEVRRVLWLKDSSGLVVPVSESTQGSQLWFISQPDGAAKRITNDLNGYGAVSFGVSSDSRTIVTVQSKPSYQIWTMSLADSTVEPLRITHGENDGSLGIDWTPEGNLVYFAPAGENIELFVVKSDGTQVQSVLKDNKVPDSPAVSPDGKAIYFTSVRSGTPHIWRINIDGTNLTQITSGDFADFAPAVSPDGKWILFVSWRSGTQLLWKIPTTGGEAQQVTNAPTRLATFSRDGKSVAAVQFVSGAGVAWQLALFPIDNPSAAKFIVPPPHFDLTGNVAWTPDGQALIVKSDQRNVGNLWRQPISGGPPTQLTEFTSDLISRFALSPDGKRLAISRGNSSLDVVLIKDFR